MLVDLSKAELGIYTFGDKSPNYVQTCQYYIKVTGLRDPGSSSIMRQQYSDGRPIGVQKYMEDDPRVQAIYENIRILAYMHLRSPQVRDGKWLSFGLVDHHGKWIAPAIGELVAGRLAAINYQVSLVHQDLTPTIIEAVS